MDPALNRILRDLGFANLVDVLADDISGADLTTLLLEVMSRRAARIDPAQVLQRYQTDRFVGPGPDFKALRAIEDALIDAASDEFEWVSLAPVVPLATHSSMEYVSQNLAVSTIRGSEVAADATSGLALEAALRRNRHLASKSAEQVHLAAFQRVLRGQYVSGPMHFAHFEVVGLVSAGRDIGTAAFEREALTKHLGIFTRALHNLGAESVRIAVAAWNGDLEGMEVAGAEVVADTRRQPGYYRDAAFSLTATFDGVEVDTGDGGAVDWTQRLCGSAKERMVVSGLGLDRIALVRV